MLGHGGGLDRRVCSLAICHGFYSCLLQIFFSREPAVLNFDSNTHRHLSLKIPNVEFFSTLDF